MKCLFCDLEARERRPTADATEFECRRCGIYSLSTGLLDWIRENGISDGYLISGMIRHGRVPKGGFGCPHFEAPEDVKRALADSPRRVPDRARALLEAVARKTDFAGDQVQLSHDEMCAYAFAKHVRELDYLRTYADELGWYTCALGGQNGILVVQPDGFEELEARQSNLNSERAFVAMWFPTDGTSERTSLDRAWLEGIKPAIEAAGYVPVRIDLEQHNDDINDRVKAEIRRSRFLVAECTGHRNGVYFEAGFAMGIPLPVIWLCRRDHFKQAHFDTEHYNHILWDRPEQIREALEFRIVGSEVGEGPLKGKR